MEKREVEIIKDISPEYQEVIMNMDQWHLEIIIALLNRHLSYDIIEELTEYDANLIEQIHRMYLPEEYLVMLQSKDSSVEDVQVTNKNRIR